MKRWMGFLIGGLVFVAVAASAFSPDWGTCRLERQEKNGSLAACRSEIFGLEKSMSIPIGA